MGEVINTVNKMNAEKAKKAVIELLRAIGENPSESRLKKTPGRAAKVFGKMLSGKGKNPGKLFRIKHGLRHDEMVLLKGLQFYSLCEHHLLPFFGKCHVAYIPDNDRVVGISRLAEMVEIMSRRLQLQERLTTEIADSIMEHLKPKGVAVVMEARHLCMEISSSKQSAEIVTSAVRGIFKKDVRTRAEFLKLIK